MDSLSRTEAPGRRRWLAPALFIAVLVGFEAFVLIQGQDRWYRGARQGLFLSAAIGLTLAAVYLWAGSRRRLRLYQVDAKTLGVLVALMAVVLSACSPYVVRGFRERAVIASLDGKSVAMYESDAPAWIVAIFEPHFGKSFTTRVYGLKITNPIEADFAQIERLASLRLLELNRCTASETGLEHLAALGALEDFYLENKSLGRRVNVSLRPFTGLRKLKFMRFNNARVQGRDISGITSVNKLHLEGCDLRDFDLGALASLNRLTFFSVRNSQCNHAGFAALSQLPIGGLDLRGSGIQDADLEHIGKFRRLRNLSLENTSISDQGLEYLWDAKQLELLWLARTSVSIDGATRLRERLPSCRIVMR